MTELRDEPFQPPIVSSELAFEGRVWNIRRDVVDYRGHEITRDYVDHTGAVAVLVMDDEGRVLLIRQYRHPIRSRDWEIPAGLRDKTGEPPLETAKRELAEEVDLVASEWALLADVATSPGGSNERVRIFLARGVEAAQSVFERTEEEQDIELLWVPLDEAVQAFLSRSLANSLLGIAILSAQSSRDRGWESLGSADAPWPGGD